MYARLLRWQDAAPSERTNLIFHELRSVHCVEREHVPGPDGISGWKLTAREFLLRIDMTHELESYGADKAK